MFFKKKVITSLLALCMLVLMLPVTPEIANAKTRLVMTDQVSKGEIYTQMYGLTCNKPGILIAKVSAQKIGCDLRLTIYGDNTSYGASSPDLATKVIKTNKKGNISGRIQTSHIMFKDRYIIKVEALSPAVNSGSVKINFYENEKNIEDASYDYNRKDDDASGAKYINITDKKTHKFMLSGYREQQDYSDYFKFSLHRTRYCALRFCTDVNDGKVPYFARILRYSDGKQIAKLGPITQKWHTKLLKLPATDYYLQVYTNKDSKLEGHQIVYSCYIVQAQRIDSIRINKKNLSLYNIKPYHTARIKASLKPAEKDKNAISYKSSNAKVASVSSSGKVTAHNPGKTVITCYAIDKQSVKAKCRVVVKAAKLKISSTNKQLYVGKTAHLSVKKTPKKQKIKWESSNAKVATVSKVGLVKAMSPGSAKIYAISDQGICSNVCRFTVKKKPQPKPKPTPDPKREDDQHDTIAPVLKLSSAHLMPKGRIIATVNVAGGSFSVTGDLIIQQKSATSCVVTASQSRGSGYLIYRLKDKSASRQILIY